MLNVENFGIANGILLADPVILNNKDGSRKVLMTVICSDMTRDENGNRTCQHIPVQGFIPKSYKGIGPYEYLHRGEEVHVEYTIKANPYQGENGIILQIDSIKFGKDIKAKLENKPEPKQPKPAPAPVKTETPAAPAAAPTPITKTTVPQVFPQENANPEPEDFDLDLDFE